MSFTTKHRWKLPAPARDVVLECCLKPNGERFDLHAAVVMPDHVHLILTPQGITVERAMGLIKGGFSHRLASKSPVWQRGFTDHRIRDAEDMETRRMYLHMNPVRGGLVAAAEEYRYSSAYRPGQK